MLIPLELVSREAIHNKANTVRSSLHTLHRSISPALIYKHLKIFKFPPIRGCSHIMSAKIRGSWTPPPPSVSNCNGQHLAYPPSPPRQQWSAFGLPPLPRSSAFVSICLMALLEYNFLRRLVYMIKWGIFIC